MNKIAKFLHKANKQVEVKDGFVFVFGTEEELDVYVDFFDDNDWLYVNNTTYKKPISKLSDRDKMKLKTDFFFDINESKDNHQILQYYKTLDKNFHYFDAKDIIILTNAFQFNLSDYPVKLKNLIKKQTGVLKGNHYIIKFDDISKNNLNQIFDMMHTLDSEMGSKYD